jgi:hypothetical protein
MKKNILYIILAIIAVYFLVQIFTPKLEIPIEYKNTIDSLSKQNNQLQLHQKLIDSAINLYSIKVDSIDNKIDSIKEKTIIIKKYYHEVSAKIDTFQTSQLDSFFNARYPKP